MDDVEGAIREYLTDVIRMSLATCWGLLGCMQCRPLLMNTKLS